jgi:hypothetical protein
MFGFALLCRAVVGDFLVALSSFKTLSTAVMVIGFAFIFFFMIISVFYIFHFLEP